MDPRMLPIISDFVISPTALSDANQVDRGGDRPGQLIKTNGGIDNTSPLPSIITGPTQMSPTTKSLPRFLLTNIRSIGNSEITDKSTEVQAELDGNKIDVACLTETWLTEDSKDRPSIDNYFIFNSVRNNVVRASGGISLDKTRQSFIFQKFTNVVHNQHKNI